MSYRKYSIAHLYTCYAKRRTLPAVFGQDRDTEIVQTINTARPPFFDFQARLPS